jgi:hypothetical protein
MGFISPGYAIGIIYGWNSYFHITHFPVRSKAGPIVIKSVGQGMSPMGAEYGYGTREDVSRKWE